MRALQMAEDWRDLNRAMWDAKAPSHVRSPAYDVAGFKAGRLLLQPHEITDLDEIAGKDLVHLQCHIGLDTLSWARLGASVTGLDFSPVSIASAAQLGREIGVPARFVEADVYDAAEALRGQQFDIVYTGVGALCWLPDMDRWAQVVRSLLRPGGQLYLFEFHPVEWIFGDAEDGGVTIAYDYFTPAEGYRDGGAVVYADDAAPVDTSATVQWNHSLGEVVTALVKAGLRIESLKELDRQVLHRWPILEPAEDGMFRMPAGKPSLPLMYVLRATRFAD